MKKTIKVLATSTLVCMMTIGLTTSSNTNKSNNSVDLLSFSLKSAQAHGEGSSNNHGPCHDGTFGPAYCGSTHCSCN
ncbi:hypothetical protein [Flavivirga jejuensis]|uniref:Uncharacterized protein n=1 Tax=Flavivirga jejuensis TaxID=870487 RepID=A0ABT8WRY8_9FLAO|nr:hypothetical protein [Flavivirga jejuensis]MDO5975934.1 hypothetical protein [Flavivirga jejuensis]